MPRTPFALSLAAALALVSAGAACMPETRSLREPAPPADHAPGLTNPERRAHEGGGLEHRAHLTRLPNGFSVLVVRDTRFPLASIRLFVRAGSAYEDEAEAGVSHVLEHMVFKGGQGGPEGNVAQEVEARGGTINAATSFDYTYYMVDAVAEHWAHGLEALAGMAFDPALDPAELEVEKEVVLSELERGEDSPSGLLFKRVQSLVWQGSSYAWPIIGARASVAGLTAQDIRRYIERHYQPQSMLLVVCGNVEEAAVLAEARRLFGGLVNTRAVSPPGLLPPAEDRGDPLVVVERGPWSRAHLAVAFPLPDLNSPDSPGLDILGNILGGGATSQLYRRFKHEAGLVHDISASAVTLERGGLFYLYASLDAAKLPAFWQGLAAYFNELHEAGSGAFDRDEVERAILHLEDDLFKAKETLSGLASKLGYFQFFEDGLEAEARFLHTVRGVDADELASLARRYLRPERLSSALLLPEGPEGQDAAALKQTLSEGWPGPSPERPTHAAGRTRPLAEPETLDLGGGRTLALLPDPTLPYVAVDLLFEGGDRLLRPDEQGLSELTARVLTKGVAAHEGRPAMDVTAMRGYLADRAASLSADSHRDSFALRLRFPSRFGPDVLGLAARVLAAPALSDPALSDPEVAREKKNQRAAIAAREDQPLGLAFRRLFPFLFTDSHYGYLHLGEAEAVAAFGPDDVRDLWDRQRAQAWSMAVCGDYDREAVVAWARTLATSPDATAELPAPTAPAPTAPAPTAPTWNPKAETVLRLPGRNQEHLLHIFPVPAAGHPDTAGLTLLRNVLTGQGGPLFRRLRDEKGLGYTVTAFLWQARGAGFMAFYIGASPERAEEALAAFRELYADLAAGDPELLAPGELARGLNQLKGDFHRDRQSLSSRSYEAARLLSRGEPLDHEERLIDRASTLGPEDLRELARRYLDPERAYLLRVKP